MKPVILKIISDDEAKTYCPQCKKFIMQLNDDTRKDFPKECPHCKEPITLQYMILASDKEELKD